MTIEIDDETIGLLVKRLHLKEDEHILNISFHPDERPMEVRFHYREEIADGSASAPAYETRILRQ